MTKNTLKVCDHIIAISNFDRNDMISKLPQYTEKYHTIYNPIRFKKFKWEGRRDKYITVLNIQWLHKNVSTIIKAYGRIVNKTNLDLILVGKKPDNIDELVELVNKKNLSERVHFTGFVSDDEMISILNQTRLYINASYFEGFGMTAVEMMGNGIPTIVANNTAQPEVTRGLCRYYSPTNDDIKLAEQILDDLEHPKSKQELTKIADIIRQSYTYENIAKQYWDYILECIES